MTARPTSHDAALSRIVERQMCNWELTRSQRLGAQTVKQPPQVQDFLTLSRMVGIQGEEIAQELARRWQWPVFDREILDFMAGDDAIRRQVYASMDERDLSWTEEALRSLLQGEFKKNDYFHRLSDTVLALARQGSAIFLGRCADLALPRDRGFRVRLAASRKSRIVALAQMRKAASADAEKEMMRIEEERATFLRHHWGGDRDDGARFDLVLNIERFSTIQAADVIAAARLHTVSFQFGPPVVGGK